MRKAMILRNIAGLIGFTALVYALKSLPMGLYMVINNTAPFVASTLSYFI
jgi:drug/metabolite transporter (DMT)-like permease